MESSATQYEGARTALVPGATVAYGRIITGMPTYAERMRELFGLSMPGNIADRAIHVCCTYICRERKRSRTVGRKIRKVDIEGK